MAIKYVGQKSLIDPETGESYEFDVLSKSCDAFDKKGWRRVILGDLMEAIEQIGNKKLKVLEFLVDNMDDKNQINLTYREIAEKTKISKETVTQTFKALKDCNLIKKYKKLYVFNTNIISVYGKADKNRFLTIEYNFTGKSLVKEKKAKIEEIEDIKKENLQQKKELAKQKKELEEFKKQQEEFKKQQEELEKLRELLKKQGKE